LDELGVRPEKHQNSLLQIVTCVVRLKLSGYFQLLKKHTNVNHLRKMQMATQER